MSLSALPGTTLAPSALLRLTRGEHTLLLAPGIGGSIFRYFSTKDQREHDWLRPGTAQSLADGNPLEMASFPLLPFCNRIRNGVAPGGQRVVNMPANVAGSPHTLHGYGWQRPWQVAALSSDAATLTLEHEPGAWPWAFFASQRIELTAERLTVRITLKNTDNVPMPAGLGHHPYFLRQTDTQIQTDVDAMWAADEEVMPTALVQPDLLAQMRAGRVLDDLVLDNNFTGWSHQARITWPQSASRLTLRADAPLDYFVLYVPPGLDHFCMEPVSNCTDWLNLADTHPGLVGGAWLAPGEILSVRFTLEPEWI